MCDERIRTMASGGLGSCLRRHCASWLALDKIAMIERC